MAAGEVVGVGGCWVSLRSGDASTCQWVHCEFERMVRVKGDPSSLADDCGRMSGFGNKSRDQFVETCDPADVGWVASG